MERQLASLARRTTPPASEQQFSNNALDGAVSLVDKKLGKKKSPSADHLGALGTKLRGLALLARSDPTLYCCEVCGGLLHTGDPEFVESHERGKKHQCILEKIRWDNETASSQLTSRAIVRLGG